LDAAKTIFAQQNPAVIDAGVFHNDVISVGNQNVLFYHEEAFLETDRVLSEILQKAGDTEMRFVKVRSDQVSVEDAVRSYLFNSQLVSLPQGMALIAPEECRSVPSVWNCLQEIAGSSDSPIREVKIFDVKQSMRNGGGPACLRLRVVLTAEEIRAANPSVFFSDLLFARLNSWVDQHYRDRIAPDDLGDPRLLDECRAALDELTSILGLGSIYPFQR
jgi:succinylarginine dihydrolase